METICISFEVLLLNLSDLPLLGVDEPFCILSEESVVLQVDFGPKQAHQRHSSPMIQLNLAPDEELCPIRHIKAYLQTNKSLKSSRMFFVTTLPPCGAATKITLKQWFT